MLILFFKRLILSGLLIGFLLSAVQSELLAQEGKGNVTYKNGKAAYDAGRFQEAIPLFKQCIQENKPSYEAKGNYMIALCYIKLGQCEKTKPHFKAAWKADPQKGGASAKEKFVGKLKECSLKISDLAAANEAYSENWVADGDSSKRNDTVSAGLASVASDNGSSNVPAFKKNASSGFAIIIFSAIGLAVVLTVVYFVVRYLNKNQGTSATSNPNRNRQFRPTGNSYPSSSGTTYRRSSGSDFGDMATGMAANAIMNSLTDTSNFQRSPSLTDSSDRS